MDSSSGMFNGCPQSADGAVGLLPVFREFLAERFLLWHENMSYLRGKALKAQVGKQRATCWENADF